MTTAISAILGSFDHGRTGALAWLLSARTKHVLFTATKADHISSNQHPNLRRLLQEMVERESNRIRFRGVDTSVAVLSSVRCARDVVGQVQGQTLNMIQGLPVGRERETALFPGEIPRTFRAGGTGRRDGSGSWTRPPAIGGADTVAHRSGRSATDPARQVPAMTARERPLAGEADPLSVRPAPLEPPLPATELPIPALPPPRRRRTLACVFAGSLALTLTGAVVGDLWMFLSAQFARSVVLGTAVAAVAAFALTFGAATVMLELASLRRQVRGLR